MSLQDSSEEVRFLRELLADAHARVRELQAQVDQLAAEVLALRLGDRRREIVSGLDGSTERERRRPGACPVEPELDRRGRGRLSAALTRVE
ncbi:MAG TPA: hypothetical protein VMH26_03950 [Burkholderiales bacterium]|nr:hypothetical protein [Burkholderiales bacterium]